MLGFGQFIGLVFIAIFQENGKPTPVSILASFLLLLYSIFGAAPATADFALRRTERPERKHQAYYASYALQAMLCITLLAYLYQNDLVSLPSFIPYIGILACLVSTGALVHAIVPDSVKLNG